MSFRFRLIINNDRFIKWKMELAVTDLLKWGQWRIYFFFVFFVVNQLIGSWMLLINRSLLTVNYRLVCWTLRLLLNWWLLAEGSRDVDWTDFWLVDRVASLWLLKGGDFRIFGPFFGIFGRFGIFLEFLSGFLWIVEGFFRIPMEFWGSFWVCEGLFGFFGDFYGILMGSREILFEFWMDFSRLFRILMGFFEIFEYLRASLGFVWDFSGSFWDSLGFSQGLSYIFRDF